MKAAVVHKPGAIPRYADFPDPQPKEGQELIRLKGASIKIVPLHDIEKVWQKEGAAGKRIVVVP